MATMISIADIYRSSIVDGNGLRVVVFGAGCSHACVGCHNPQSWDINYGTWLSIQEVFNNLNLARRKLLRGVTFSGGDPMYQPMAFYELACMVKTIPNLDVWCYTGYQFEDLICNHDERYELLTQVDVLVDGQYVQELRDLTLQFRGSSNQRIIDVPKSLEHGMVIEYIVSRF